MHCIPKSFLQFLTRRMGDSETLLSKEVEPDLRILLIGRKGSGKTTFLKRANQKFGKGFSESEELGYKKIVINNLYKTAADLFDALEYSEIDLVVDEKVIQEIKEQCEVWTDTIPEKHFETIRKVWSEPRVKSMYAEECFGGEYYLDQISRIASPIYTPTVHEMMCLEPPTIVPRTQIVRVNEIIFEVTDIPGCEEEEVSRVVTEKYDMAIYFMSLSEFREVNTTDEIQLISENISNLKKVIKTVGKETILLLYFTQTHDYLMTQKYTPRNKNADYIETAKNNVFRYFVNLAESIPNSIYRYLEDTHKLNNMKLVYKLMKYEEMLKNLRNIDIPLV